MTDYELEEHLHETESELVEGKGSLPGRGKIRQAIVAYANDLPNHDRPGVISLGTTDDGHGNESAITVMAST